MNLGCRTWSIALAGVAVLAASAADDGAGQERVEDFGAMVPRLAPIAGAPVASALERITTAVPWPRGLAFADGELVVLARGRHRRAGGLDPAIADHAGTLYLVDPAIAEPVAAGREAGQAVRGNARVLATPTDPPFRLHDGLAEPPDAVWIDRPYCALVYDERSRSYFVCGYSGVDMPDGSFRKNATDVILRFDARDRRWHTVERHDASVVGPGELGQVVSSRHYPHHDPAVHPPPHGWTNGANAACVAGSVLYIAAKDNHLVVGYDLTEIRRDPAAGPPGSGPVLETTIELHHPLGRRNVELLGPSALAVHGGHLYVGYRTSSVVVRYALDDRGRLAEPNKAELIAVFEPWSAARGRSADLIDIAFDQAGELFVSCGTEGRIWRVGVPDPEAPFYGDDQGDRPTTAPPYVDLAVLLGKEARCGDIAFDDLGRLYLCSGACDTGTSQGPMGAVYRVVTP